MADPTLIIDAEPDWGETPEVAYGFSTVIQGNPFFKEQRRPLLPSVARSISCSFKVENENAQRILNRLISGAPQVCCTPVYSEPLFASVITQGASLLTIQTDLTYLWNAQNSSYLVLLDYTTGASEMLRVASVTGQAVTLSAPIVGAWTAAQTVIYPAFASVLRDVKTSNPTSRLVSFDVQFEEISIGAEATKVWVGLDEQVCVGVPSLWTLWLDKSYGNSAVFETVAGYGEVLHLNAWSQVYIGSFGANAEANHIFPRVGILKVSFDYFHGEDYWYDDDFTDSQFWFGIYPEAYTVLTGYWQYGIPGATAVIALKLRKLSTARVTLVTSNLGVIANPAVTGLASGLYASNHYEMEVNWPGHTISVRVNGILVINAVSFGTGLDSLFGSTFKVLFHQHSYASTSANRYIKDFRITL